MTTTKFIDVLKLAENVLKAKNQKPKAADIQNKAIEIFKTYDLDGDGIITSNGKKGDEVAKLSLEYGSYLKGSIFNNAKIRTNDKIKGQITTQVEVNGDNQADFVSIVKNNKVTYGSYKDQQNGVTYNR